MSNRIKINKAQTNTRRGLNNNNYVRFQEFNNLETEVNVDKSSLLDITSDTTVLDTISYYEIDSSAGNVTMTLDPTYLTAGREFTFKKVNASNKLFIAPASGYTIDGDTQGVEIDLINTVITIRWTGEQFKITR